MASGAQAHPSFPPRNTFATSTKLPDRAGLNPPFGQSALNNPIQSFGQTIPRRNDPQTQFGQTQAAPQPPQHAQQGRQQQQEKPRNYLAELSEEQREEVNEAVCRSATITLSPSLANTSQFNLFDMDRDRHLDYHELRVAMRALGFSLPKQEIVQILMQSGVARPSPYAQRPNPSTRPLDTPPAHRLISLAAFQQLAAQRIQDRDPTEEINRAFDLFDIDRKNYINMEDLRRVAGELGETGLEEDELAAMIEEFDLEGLGGVSRESFQSICLHSQSF